MSEDFGVRRKTDLLEVAKILCDFMEYGPGPGTGRIALHGSRVKRKDEVRDKTPRSYGGAVTETTLQRHLPSTHLHTINISELVQTHTRDHEEGGGGGGRLLYATKDPHFRFGTLTAPNLNFLNKKRVYILRRELICKCAAGLCSCPNACLPEQAVTSYLVPLGAFIYSVFYIKSFV
ncbi:hypothetical protein V6N13_120489 [Hibiscus sabdariffa]|uniref:Uncharacterized protein n=1 Tax=Hibiscus sabdariffa TaxID=183260 RepID=A0ABR2E4E9_9ROSI